MTFAAARARRTPPAALIFAAIAAAAATTILTLIPWPHPAPPRQSGQLALDVAASVIALLACFLVFGRLRRRATLSELMLACALAMLALSDLFLVTVPVTAGWAPDALTIWATPAARLVATLLFALAAFAPERPLRRSGLMLAGAGGVTTALLLAAVAVPALDRRLPPAVQPSPAQFWLELTTAALCGMAAVRFVQRSRRSGDEFFGWLAIAAVFAAGSHVYYSLDPAGTSQFVHPGDAFRFAFYVVLLAGSVREIWSFWQALSKTAVIEERRRIACELHDGLAQELAYLARNLDSLHGSVAKDDLGRLCRAVERARLESRRAISALVATSGQPFEVALAEAVTEIAERYRLDLDLDLTPDIRPSAVLREALVRIACEAVTNAARHSGTCRAVLALERDGSHIRLRISDDGHGFDIGAGTRASGGFGLVSMRERAHCVGAELLISSEPGHGCQVEVAV